MRLKKDSIGGEILQVKVIVCIVKYYTDNTKGIKYSLVIKGCKKLEICFKIN